MKYTFTLLFLVGLGHLVMAQESYNLSDKSSLTIDGTSTVHDWTVNANVLEGQLILGDDLPKKIDFNVDVENIKSERGPTMDSKMHAALKMESHPKIVFNLEEVKDKSTLIGNLTIAGKGKKVEIPVDIQSSEGGIKISGEHKITLKNYGIEPPTAMFGQIIVGDEVTVKFDLQFDE
ncbi:YceI-like domain-containing protein [Flavobacteriaceae bacterium MAR_2009_75]|nr:YceI-like domain-containing protein [Flavobacteriaceae bacterium MAR_2009_75]